MLKKFEQTWINNLILHKNDWNHIILKYPVEDDSLVPVPAAVEENVSCGFKKLQDKACVSCAQSYILSCLKTPEIQDFSVW